MAENLQAPLPPLAEEEERERRGGGFFFWLNSTPVRVAFVTAVSMLAFLVARDYFFGRQAGNPRLDTARGDRPATASLTGTESRDLAANADDPFGLGERPPPALPREASGLVGAVSTGNLNKGAHAWGGLRPESEKQRSGASAADKARFEEKGDAARVARPKGRQAGGASPTAGASSAAGRGEGMGVGRMDNEERESKSIMRGWAWKGGQGGTKLELGQSGALDKLKGMEASMKSYGGGNATSAQSAHKKMWDAASYTDWKLQTQTTKGRSSVRDYKIGGKAVARDPLVDAGEGGPLSSAAQAERVRSEGGAGKTFTADEAPEEETGSARGAELLPLASQALLRATGLRAEDLPSDIDAAQAMGQSLGGGLVGLSGVGMMATGQTVQGASLAGLAALLEAQRRAAP